MRVLWIVAFGTVVAGGGCGGGTQATSTAAVEPAAPTLSADAVARKRAFVGEEGLRVEVVDLTAGGALLRVSGVISEVAGKVFECTRVEGSRPAYQTQLHGRDWNLLVGETSSWGGGHTRWLSFAPGAPSGGYPVAYDEEASAAVDAQQLYAVHVAQERSGELDALARFDRASERADEDARLEERAAATGEACGATLQARIEWATVSDAQLRDKSVSGYCSNVLTALQDLCRFEAGKQFVQQHVKRMTCRLDGDAELALKGDELTWAVGFETANLHTHARERLSELQPEGSSQPVGDAILTEQTAVCLHAKSGKAVLLGPEETAFGGLAYGGPETFTRIPTTPALGDGWFFDPRQYNETHNPNFRGLDLRLYSRVELDAEAGTCTLVCGSRETELTLLTGEPKTQLLAGAKFEPSPQDREAYALARDKRGIYYYVDRGRTPQTQKDFHLYRGKRGRLKKLAMKDVVSDSEGEIFESPDGKLRLLLDRSQASWTAKQHKQPLTRLPIEENYPLIYNELGVYLGKRLGVPCDDL